MDLLETNPVKVPPISPDEANRLWQHGLHEERLFHDRLNYFSILEMGLLTICGIMYNKEPALGFFVPLTLIALVFTLLWMVIQSRHWAYCKHVTERGKRLIPEFKATVDEFSEGKWSRSQSVSEILALSVPALFACCWLVFFIWLLVRPAAVAQEESLLSLDRVLLGGLILTAAWLWYRLHRVERLLAARLQAEKR